MRGLIALDIDGTLTTGLGKISPAVVACLKKLSDSGWELAFITGRCFAWTYPSLKDLPFPFHMGVQNGATLFQMPQQKIVATRTVCSSHFEKMAQICHAYQTDYAIFSWRDNKDVVYYRPHCHQEAMRTYLEGRARKLGETWIAVATYDSLDLSDAPSLKVIADHTTATLVSREVEASLNLHCPLIHDPYEPGYFVAQITHPEANKGEAARTLYRLVGGRGPLIAAGDDSNDRPMLEAADYRIVMQTAPQELQRLAHHIAPSAAEEGIVPALQHAVIAVEEGNDGAC